MSGSGLLVVLNDDPPGAVGTETKKFVATCRAEESDLGVNLDLLGERNDWVEPEEKPL